MRTETTEAYKRVVEGEIMENAVKEGIDKSFMGSTHKDNISHIDTPFTEEHIDKIQADINAVFIEMIKHKKKILQHEHAWSDEYTEKKDVPWDIDVAYCKQQWGGWQLKEIHDKMDMIADFARIDRDKLHLLYDEFVPEEDALCSDYDRFYKYTKNSTWDIEKHVHNFVSMLMDDDFIKDKASEYGEPGYTKGSDDNTIITANWNGLSSGIYDIIESNGFDMEWSDEWVCDCNENKLYRSQPDSYSWEPSFFYDDYGLYGIADNEELYIESMINKSHALLSAKVDLEKHGFVDLEEICRETGWYGTVEDPEEVFDRYDNEYEEMVVQTCSISQFAVNWKVWGRNIDD